MKTTLIALGSIALLSGAAFASDNSADSDSGNGKNDRFAMLDSDSDGKLSKDEVSGSESLTASFSMIDRNSDGYISKGEFRRNTMPKPRKD